MKDVRLLAEPFFPGAFVGPFTNAHPGMGGACTFVGEVRGGDGVEALELSHYEPLTLGGMNELADAALARFDLMGLQRHVKVLGIFCRLWYRDGKRGYLAQLDQLSGMVRSYELREQGHGLFVFRRRPTRPATSRPGTRSPRARS